MKPIRLLCFILAMFMILAPAVFAQSPADYEALKQKYDELAKDRDNLKAQTEILLGYKSEINKAQQQLTRIETERNKWQIEEESLRSQIKRLQSENELLMSKVENLQADNFQIEEERDALRKNMSKTKSSYIIVDDLKRQIKDNKKEIKYLEGKNKELKKEADRADDKIAKAETVSDVLRDQVKEIKQKYKKSVAKNRVLEKKLNYQPREYAEIARENKILLKRTALMHYNLGVFYSKSQEYSRAISEFEKSIELNPTDSQAYFNLGYIYAEHFENRPKAIRNFEKYLQLAKKGDKDIDWVKKYILTWQTWEGKSISK